MRIVVLVFFLGGSPVVAAQTPLAWSLAIQEATKVKPVPPRPALPVQPIQVPMTYSEFQQKAFSTGKPLVVFVNCPVWAVPEGWLVHKAQTFPDAKDSAVVIGVPIGTTLYRVDLESPATTQEMEQAVTGLQEAVRRSEQRKVATPFQGWRAPTRIRGSSSLSFGSVRSC